VTSRAGVAKIARFNWPWYVAAMAVTAAAAIVIRSGVLPERSVPLAIAALLIADFWIIASLVVSHYVYDLSPISRGAWLAGIEPAAVRRAAVFHAGQDEGSQAAIQRLPAATVETFDFYDPAGAGSPSLERARALADSRARAIAADRIPLEDASLDLGLVVFAAHEIRRAETRTAFFRELGRVVAPSGRVVVVEHLRDVWNFIAYGPGALHFQSRGAWVRAFASAGLTVLRERPCTPFVRVFELGRPS
jgi:SAM-dependent methyltransferase